MIKRVAMAALIAATVAGCQSALPLKNVATKTAPLEVGDDSLAPVALARIQIALKRGTVIGPIKPT